MQNGTTSTSREHQAAAHLTQSIRQAFCTTVHATGLPPMTILKLAAIELGMIYKEAAAAHCGTNGCPCGWEPDESADLEALQAALVAAVMAAVRFDLRVAAPAGHG